MTSTDSKMVLRYPDPESLSQVSLRKHFEKSYRDGLTAGIFRLCPVGFGSSASTTGLTFHLIRFIIPGTNFTFHTHHSTFRIVQEVTGWTNYIRRYSLWKLTDFSENHFDHVIFHSQGHFKIV